MMSVGDALITILAFHQVESRLTLLRRTSILKTCKMHTKNLKEKTQKTFNRLI